MTQIDVGGSYSASTKNSFPSDVEYTREQETKYDNVNKPRHYNREGAMECIDEMELVFGAEATMYYCLLNCWKYRYRAGFKNDGFEDIEKSDWYMRRYKELKEKIEANEIITTQPISPWTITPMVTPTTNPNWWKDTDYSITCNTNTTVASK